MLGINMEIVLLMISLLLFPCLSQVPSIRDVILNKDEFAEFRKRIDGIPLFEEKLNPGRNGGAEYTVFVSNNEAFRKLSQAQSSRLSQASLDVKTMILGYHMIKGTISKSALAQEKTRFSWDGERLFFNEYKGITYVNGVRIGDSIECSNGIIHEIESVLLIDRPNTNNLYYYIFFGNSKERFREFRKVLALVDGMNSLLKNSQGITFFLPSNEAFQNLPVAQKAKLQTTESLATKVVYAHIISSDAVYTSYLKAGQRFKSYSPSSEYQEVEIYGSASGSSFFVVSNDTSVQLSEPLNRNITVSNGVVHVINKLFYQYNTAMAHIKEDPQLREMEIAINNAYKVAGGKRIKDTLENVGSVVTVFAPTSAAFNAIQANSDSRNFTKMAEAMKMSVIVGKRIPLMKIQDGEEETSMSGKKILFFRETDQNGNTEVYVESGYIRARIVEPDVGVLNGVIHYIDHVFHYPYRNIYQEIKDNPDLDETEKKITQLSFLNVVNLNTNEGDYTFFASSDSAWKTLYDTWGTESFAEPLLEMKAASRDREDFMNVWTNVMRRCVGTRRVYIGELKNTDVTMGVTTLNGRVDLKNEGGEWFVMFKVQGAEKKAKITRKDIGLKNGVMHIIDTVMADLTPNTRTGDWISATSVTSSSPVIIALLTSFCIVSVIR